MAKKDMVRALNQLADAFNNVMTEWEKFNLDVKCNNEKYPFKKSFDELECAVSEWVEDIVEQLED